MSGMTGGSMLRTRKKDANVKPNRRLDRKSSRGMLYENEELRLRTININAEVERGQSDIKKLKRENEQLRREVGALRGEYDRLERLLKARHMEELSDAEGSGSCCSDCESECCNIQNDANAACDNKEDFLMCCQNDASVGFKANEGYPKDFISHSMTSSFESCGTLSAVPEEPMTPQPCSQTKGLQACNCQMLSNDLDNEKSASMPNDNNQEFFTAVVTVPLASHLPKPTDVHPTAIFPKAGLDILINNNAFEKFEGFTISPPIGFILPPSPNCNQSNDESYQLVPKVDLTDDNQHDFTVNDLTPINNQSEQPNYNISSQNTYNGENLFPADGNLDDFLKCVDTFTDKDNMNSVKDSFFVCNTRKVIQKLTVHNSSNLNNSGNKVKYNPNEEETLANFNDDESNPNVESKQSFRTEKNIELNYDYPRKPVGKREQKIFIEPIDKHEQTICTDITETTHTTTEINSTLLLFERKNLDNKGQKRGEKFERSHSAPVEPFVDEPIYATVKKLPNKLKRLHIKKLENEVTYIPPEEKSIEEKKNSDLAESSTNIPSILKIPDLELSDSILKNNGIPKTRLKLDSLSESSEKIEINHNANIIPKSPIARKKKRFSIHFKRKGNKKPPPSKPIDNPEPSVEVVENQADKNKPDEGKIDSDRLLEQSSSLDIPDTVRFKDNGNNYTCRKHSRQLKSNVPHNCTKSRQCLNCECSKVHHCERCLGHRKYSLKDHEHNKKRHSPVRHYFKHDSYQEITTSHSERERTNSLSSSAHSGFSLATNKSRKMSVTHREGSIPWCGCWGNSCL